MTRVRVLREAAEELRAAAEYYEAQRPGLGRALLQEVRLVYQRMSDHPAASRIERNEVRVRAVGRFPYRIYYRARHDEILIIAVAHKRRRPDFWVTRTT